MNVIFGIGSKKVGSYLDIKGKMGQRKPQSYDYFIVLDFEATCQKNIQLVPQEIIEFPALKVNSTTYEVETKFHQFVKPVVHPQLTDFCKELTTITQAEVDNASEFSKVMGDFRAWINSEMQGKSFIYVTCGDWDMETMLPAQCRLSGEEVPDHCKSWVNIKKSYRNYTKHFARGLIEMLEGLGIGHTGTLHRGLDDCINILNILRGLADRGVQFSPSNKCIQARLS
ncbi:ERI1 exoribonuclease 3-like isoform X2 [Macrobrachium nipponense]|uniref:ERI1 exoribonuclease 3-like isoform X2 n=1 Tax=Macrobrachium nipponense TaxID=159736 RepID=UPI0030C8C067